MKKYLPFVFFAIMAGLVGAKVAVAADTSVEAPGGSGAALIC